MLCSDPLFELTADRATFFGRQRDQFVIARRSREYRRPIDLPLHPVVLDGDVANGAESVDVLGGLGSSNGNSVKGGDCCGDREPMAYRAAHCGVTQPLHGGAGGGLGTDLTASAAC